MIWPKCPENSPIRLRNQATKLRKILWEDKICWFVYFTQINTRKVGRLFRIFGPTSTQQVVDAAGSVGSIMESFDNENEDKRTQQASHKQTNKQKLGPADAAGEWITVSHKQTNKRGQADTACETFSIFSTSFTKRFPWIKPKLLGVVLWGAG